ncbi:MAG TPA: hypothetical protein QGH10_15305, partial [Armatimonadota bacterium]|nr:hypothetical protein [Armatimonadota bacterium]
LDAATGQLSQAIRFVNETSRPDVFVTLALRAVLDPEFRQQAQYTGGSYLGPLVPAASIRERVLTDSFKQPWSTGITNGRPSWVLALNNDLGVNFATFRYRVNEQHVLPWNAIWTEPLNNLYHTPAGWEMGVCTLALRPSETASVEVDYMLFGGGLLGFYDRYRSLPEVAAMHARVGPRPTWLQDVKMPVLDTIQQALAVSEEGLLLRAGDPFGVWGDPLARDEAGNDTRLVARGKELLGAIREASPRVRAGLYTWAWSAAEQSREMQQHPEWFIVRDKAGQTRNAYPMGTNYVRCLSAPGCLDDMLQRYCDIVRGYPEDLQYLDNDGTGIQVIDWEHLRVDQDYHWQRLHEGILAAAREHSPETATFFNNRVLPQGDISFAELMPAEIQNTHWRRPADELYPIKVFQKRDPERVASLLYSRPETEPSYTNYCVGLGLLPWMSSVRQLPFINAAFETRRLELMDADLTPDWHDDLTTSIEAYPLRQGAAACVSFIGHEETPQETQIAFDSARMGLTPGRAYSAWLFDLKDSREHEGRLTERDQRLAYDDCNWADEVVVAASFLGAGEDLPTRFICDTVARPRRLRMLMVTHSPGLVWSVNGRRTHFWLPDSRGVSLRRGSGGRPDRVTVVCRCEPERAEVAILVPGGQRVSEVTVDGTPTPWAPESVGGAWLVRVGVTRGANR